MPRFQGVVIPTVTLFDESGSIDWEANGRLTDRLIESGADALFPLGTTGEAQHLTYDERERMIRWSADYVGGRVPVLAGVGDPSTEVTRRLARAAQDAGADGVVVVGPYFWILDERSLYAHFRAVAESVEIPVLLYNFPRFVGVNLSPDLVLRLADDCPNLVGIKETLDSGTHIRQMVLRVKSAHPEFSVLCGHDDLSLFALTAGGDGVVSSTANFAPELFRELLSSHRDGDLRKAEAVSARIGRLVEVYQTDPFGGAVAKAALKLRGWIDNPAPRLPALPLPPDRIAAMKRIMSEAGLPTE
jgi:4-hydroxy-tetrahydrodipicolinate synthase